MKHLFIYALITLFSNEVYSEVIRLPINRNSGLRPIHSKRSTQVTQSLYNNEGIEYLIEIGVGTPSQNFNVSFDTGSADVWIPSTSCPVAMCPLTRFNATKSSTYAADTEAFMIEYGLGSAQGIYARDTFTFPGSEAKLSNFTFALATNTKDIISESYDEHPTSNGVFGLGFPYLSFKSLDKQKHFVIQLYESNLIPEPVFSIFLNSQFMYGNTGELMIGGIDPTRHIGEIEYVPVVTYDVSAYYIHPNVGINATKLQAASQEQLVYWSVPGQGVSTSAGYSSNLTTLTAYIMDSGNTLTYIPPKLAEAIVMSATNKSKETVYDSYNEIYIVDCGLAAKSKPTDVVEFHMSTSASEKSAKPITITVPVSDLIIPIDDAVNAETSSLCMFGIAPVPAGLDLALGEIWIVGQSVLRSVYTVYDLNQTRIGVARAQYADVSVPIPPVEDTPAPNDDDSNNTYRYNNNDVSHADSLSTSNLLPGLFTLMFCICGYINM